jgi:hypothetical protein
VRACVAPSKTNNEKHTGGCSARTNEDQSIKKWKTIQDDDDIEVGGVGGPFGQVYGHCRREMKNNNKLSNPYAMDHSKRSIELIYTFLFSIGATLHRY